MKTGLVNLDTLFSNPQPKKNISNQQIPKINFQFLK